MAYNLLDLYHRAFKAYKDELSYGEKENKLHRAVCRAVGARETLKAVRFKCQIKTDWIERIEKSLPFLEKAILENRQFILQQGEIQLIEKAKRVSKASVEHLSRHSELITREPKEGEDLIPEKIYVVENDSNFAVYENRFLYMLLNDLSDCVDLKYAKIVEFWNKFATKLLLEKNVILGKHKIDFSLALKEEGRAEDESIYDEETKNSVTRIVEIQRVVGLLLQSALMREMSHAPKIKPPVTRTNVLKMDPNFKMAVELYDYLCSYEDDGYRVQEFNEDIDNFPEAMEGDFAELVMTSSYLARRYGGNLDEQLESRYEAETQRRYEEEDLRDREELRALRQQWESGKGSVEEYIKALEERNGQLEGDRDRLHIAQNELFLQKQEISTLTESRDAYASSVDELKGTLAAQERAARETEARYQAELARQKQEYEDALAEKQKEYDALEERRLATAAQLRAVRFEHGLMTPEEDYSSKEMLMELERERKAFQKLFASQWKSAKKQIRQRIFRIETKQDKNERGDNE